MRWTVWQRRTKCQNCGAKVSVPETGLTMTCQYCGVESPVPDIEERQRRQHKQQQRQEQKQKREQKPRRREQPSRSRTRTRRGVLGLIKFVLGVGILGAVLHFTGVLSQITEPLFGDDGRAHYAEAAARLKQIGYTRLTAQKTERAFRETKHYLDVKPGHRYALVLGSGRPLARVTVKGPRGRRVVHSDTLRFHEALVFTPRVAGVYTAVVQLESPGRYRWALHRGPKVTGADAARDLLDQRRRRRKRRARKRRRRRRTRVTTSRARKRPRSPAPKAEPTLKTEPAPGLPPEPKPIRPKVDPDIERALRAGELDDP